jgi:hypothetical protein
MRSLGALKHLVIQNKGVFMEFIFLERPDGPVNCCIATFLAVVLLYDQKKTASESANICARFSLDNVGPLPMLKVVFDFWQLWRFIPIYNGHL